MYVYIYICNIYVYIYIYRFIPTRLYNLKNPENGPGCLTVGIHPEAAERLHGSMLPGFHPLLDFFWISWAFNRTFPVSNHLQDMFTFMIYLFMDIYRCPIYL